MSIETSEHIGYGLVYTLENITDLRNFLPDDEKSILSPANLAQGNYVFGEVLEALELRPGLSAGVSQDQWSDSFTPSLIIYAPSTLVKINFREGGIPAFAISQLNKPTEEEMKAFEVFTDSDGNLRKPEPIFWGSVF